MPNFNDTITQLSGTSTFYDWFIKENTEIISKLNLATVSGVTSGDGVLSSLNSTSGLVTLSIGGTSGNITKGLTFSGPVSFLGETVVPNISYKITGITSGTSGYTFGTVIRIASTGYTWAIANSADSAEVVGVISSKTPSYSVVTISGRIDGDFTQTNVTAGETLSPGCVYFLSADPANKGKITTTEPSTVGEVSKPVIIGLGATAGMVIQYRGNYLNAQAGGGGESGTNRLYITMSTTSVDPRSQGFSAGVFLSYAPDVLAGYTFFNKYLTDTGRTAINGWFVSGSKNFAYRTYEFGSPYLNVPNEEDFVVGMVENITTVGGSNLLYRIIARGTSDVVPKSIALFSGNPSGFWALSGATFSPTGSTGQLVQNSPNTQSNPYAPLYQVGLVTSNSPTSWYVNPRPLTSNPTSVYKQTTQLPEKLTNGLNFAYNGDFSIWQRKTGRSTDYTASGNVYFADNWIRRMSGFTGVQSLQRNSFPITQTEVEGYPKYYTRIKGLPTLAAGGGTIPSNPVYSIGHVIEGCDTFYNEPITVSLYAKCNYLPYQTLNVYFARYNNIGLVKKTVIGQITTNTSWNKYVINYTDTETPNAGSGDDYIEIGVDLSTLITTAYVNNLSTSTNASFDIASMAIYTGSYSAPPHMFIPDSDKLLRSQKYYYQTYIDETDPATKTMNGLDPLLSTFTFTVVPNTPYGLIKFPTLMRTTPSVNIYSSGTGLTGELWNVTANADLRNTGGSKGYNGLTRYTQYGIPTVTVDTNKTAARLSLNMGYVNFDVISGNIIADASYPI